jgi:hypothetical protein
VSDAFTIRFRDVSPMQQDFAKYVRFQVTRHDGDPYTVFVRIPNAALDDSGWPEALLEIALHKLETAIAVSGLEDAEVGEGSTRHLTVTSDEVRRAIASRDANKLCVWQQRDQRSWTCLASDAAPKTTTPTLCDACAVPDARTVCSALMQPTTTLQVQRGGDGQVLFERRPMTMNPGCLASESPGNGNDCRIGGNDCWRRSVTSRVRSPLDLPGDIPRAVADELDYLRLVASDRLKLKDAVPVRQARSVGALFAEPSTSEDLQRQLAAVADLITNLSFIEALPDDQRTDDKGRQVKSLKALELVLLHHAPDAVPAVTDLRAIVKVRNTFPIHSRTTEVAEEFRALGVGYPPSDWGVAWNRILERFWASIRRIREGLQAIVDE